MVKILHAFTGPDGEDPQGPLTLGNDGNFYGETELGGIGADAMGTIFRVTPEGVLTTLHTFSSNGSAGTQRAGGLVVGSDGSVYGMT